MSEGANLGGEVYKVKFCMVIWGPGGIAPSWIYEL